MELNSKVTHDLCAALVELKKWMIVNDVPQKKRQKLMRNLRVSCNICFFMLFLPFHFFLVVLPGFVFLVFLFHGLIIGPVLIAGHCPPPLGEEMRARGGGSIMLIIGSRNSLRGGGFWARILRRGGGGVRVQVRGNFHILTSKKKKKTSEGGGGG